MAMYIYDIVRDDSKVVELDRYHLPRYVAPLGVREDSRNMATLKHVARAITHHNVLVVPDDIQRHTDLIEKLKAIARILDVPVMSVSNYINEKKKATAAAQPTAPAPQQDAAAAGHQQ